jgi:PPOX class probable F420-dependent enzyme
MNSVGDYARDMAVIPDSDFGQRARRRLADESVVWLTTTAADGTPQPNPVWFLWEPDDEVVVIYNATDAKRLDRFAARPRVALHFDSNGRGGDIVVLTGAAEQAPDVPQADENDAYLAKYGEAISRMTMDPAQFAQAYSVPIRVRVTRVRGH